jgi:hypothetical protein
MSDQTPAESGTPTENAPAPVEQTAPPSPANMPQTAPPAQAAAEPTEDNDGGKSDVSAEIKALRKEAAKYRTQLRQQEEASAAAQQIVEQLQAQMNESNERWNKFSELFNPNADKPMTVEELTEKFSGERSQWESKAAEYETKLSEYDQKVRDLTIRAALPAAVSKASADPALTEAVLTASGVLGKLDPSSESFAADLESAVAAAVEANPRLKMAPVATRSGAPIPGRSGGDGQLTREDVQRMAKTDPEGLVKAQKEGRLRSLGIS